MDYSSVAKKAVEVKPLPVKSVVKKEEPKRKICTNYKSGFSKDISESDKDLYYRLAGSRIDSHKNCVWKKEWGKRPPGAKPREHYLYWISEYEEEIKEIYYQVKKSIDEHKELDFEDFCKFAYSQSSGYIRDN